MSVSNIHNAYLKLVNWQGDSSIDFYLDFIETFYYIVTVPVTLCDVAVIT